MQGKTIAIFGASSSIGSKVTIEAAKRGATVIAIVRNINNIPSQLKEGYTGRIVVIKGDMTKAKDVRTAIKGKNIDVTINFSVDFSPDYSKAKKVNVLGEQYILDASIKSGVKRHIYISTIATLMQKSTSYRDTKLQAEESVKASGKKIDWIILRYAHVLGGRTWSKPFKIIIPFLRLGIPKAPTDTKDAAFPYATIDTVINATLAAVEAKPNQAITVLDGKTTIGEYLSTMEKIYKVRWSFLPSRLLKLLDNLFGKYLSPITGHSAALDFLAHPPEFENETMKRELKVKPRDFHKWIKVNKRKLI